MLDCRAVQVGISNRRRARLLLLDGEGLRVHFECLLKLALVLVDERNAGCMHVLAYVHMY